MPLKSDSIVTNVTGLLHWPEGTARFCGPKVIVRGCEIRYYVLVNNCYYRI
jgi:hypothetical protein